MSRAASMWRAGPWRLPPHPSPTHTQVHPSHQAVIKIHRIHTPRLPPPPHLPGPP
ncbi:hypothetical protein E2C01_075075 [Portunus trituberculatus]|uniref:Uncharacterized protein n=1 Tax=Portunus trituberculatus TaxID=210409 RepID=A0A5B7IE36_PORTR|nr:hypothetical protein [Portunus trituberculatus]